MKLFELAEALRTLIPGNLDRAPFWREFISTFTFFTSEDLEKRLDPTVIPSDATLESMNSRDDAFPRKFAKAICARLDTDNFIDLLAAVPPETKTLMIENLRDLGEQIDPDDFPYQVSCLLVQILHERARVKTDLTKRFRQMRIHAELARYRDLILVRAHGCARCGTWLETESHGYHTDSFAIVFLDSDAEEPGPEAFAVLCKPCAEKFTLAHTAEEAQALIQRNLDLVADAELEADLAPLDLDQRITALLRKINSLPLEELNEDRNYTPAPLREKITGSSLLIQCRNSMVFYEHHVREQAKALEETGELDFDLMCHQIRSAWFAMRREEATQKAVWQRLTRWVHERTDEDLYACEVLVAFMIQICEVFSARKVPDAQVA